MAVNVINLTQGPATLYTGAFGAAEPADSAVNATPPTSSWTDVGGTTGGVQININQTFATLAVDQIVDTPGRRLTARDVQVQTTLAETTLANLSTALNGSSASSAAGYSAIDPVIDSSAVTPGYIAILIDGQAPGSASGAFRRRTIVRKVLSIDNTSQQHAKDTQNGIPVTFGAHYVSPSIKPFHIVDQTS